MTEWLDRPPGFWAENLAGELCSYHRDVLPGAGSTTRLYLYFRHRDWL